MERFFLGGGGGGEISALSACGFVEVLTVTVKQAKPWTIEVFQECLLC